MEFGYNGFEERGRMEYPKKNLSEQRTEPAKKLSHAFASMPGFERGPNWCIGGKCPYHCAKKRQMLHCNRIIYTGIYDWLNEQDAVDL